MQLSTQPLSSCQPGVPSAPDPACLVPGFPGRHGWPARGGGGGKRPLTARGSLSRQQFGDRWLRPAEAKMGPLCGSDFNTLSVVPVGAGNGPGWLSANWEVSQQNGCQAEAVWSTDCGVVFQAARLPSRGRHLEGGQGGACWWVASKTKHRMQLVGRRKSSCWEPPLPPLASASQPGGEESFAHHSPPPACVGASVCVWRGRIDRHLQATQVLNTMHWLALVGSSESPSVLVPRLLPSTLSGHSGGGGLLLHALQAELQGGHCAVRGPLPWEGPPPPPHPVPP